MPQSSKKHNQAARPDDAQQEASQDCRPVGPVEAEAQQEKYAYGYLHHADPEGVDIDAGSEPLHHQLVDHIHDPQGKGDHQRHEHP